MPEPLTNLFVQLPTEQENFNYETNIETNMKLLKSPNLSNCLTQSSNVYQNNLQRIAHKLTTSMVSFEKTLQQISLRENHPVNEVAVFLLHKILHLEMLSALLCFEKFNKTQPFSHNLDQQQIHFTPSMVVEVLDRLQNDEIFQSRNQNLFLLKSNLVAGREEESSSTYATLN